MLKAGGVKTNRLISSSAVGARFACPKTQSKLSGEQPHPYELNDSIIHILTHSPVFYKAYCLLIYNLLSHITAAEIFYSWAFGVKVVFLVTILF